VRSHQTVRNRAIDTGREGPCTYPGDVAATFREAGKKLLIEGAALVRQFGLEPEAITVESLNGKVAPLIVAHAKEWGADLIVMGTHGRHGLKRLAMGSEAESVVRKTRIPVLLVNISGDRRPASRPARRVRSHQTEHGRRVGGLKVHGDTGDHGDRR
jgi:nucleotide-binding universal stress UspA family protein